MLPSFLNRFSYFMNLWWCLWSFSVDIIQYKLEDAALLFFFLSEPVKVCFLPCIDTFSSDMLFIVSKQYACSRRVHIEGHMNRFEFWSSWTIIPITGSVGTNWRKCYASKLTLKWQRFCLIGKPSMFFPSFLNHFSSIVLGLFRQKIVSFAA
jgi:hypothetical protein